MLFYFYENPVHLQRFLETDIFEEYAQKLYKISFGNGTAFECQFFCQRKRGFRGV